jgi:hypothetical protein
MTYRILAIATVLSLSSAPVLAAELNKIEVAKDRLTPTQAISQLVPVMTYNDGVKSSLEDSNSQIYTNQIGDLVPTMKSPSN